MSSSTAVWMESLIKKKQDKKGKSLLLSSQPVPESMDDFEELNRYLRKPRLTRAECPNAIPWWGVSHKEYGSMHWTILKYFTSTSLRIQFSD